MHRTQKASARKDARSLSHARESSPLLLMESARAASVVQPETESQRREKAEKARMAYDFISNAMAYLSDSRELHFNQVADLTQNQPELKAMMILVDAKREIYLDCQYKERRKNGLFGSFRSNERRKSNQN